MDINVSLENAAKKHAERAVKVFADVNIELSYTEIEMYSRRISAYLREAGIRPGVRVGIWMGNQPEHVLIFAACLRIGAVIVPISVHLREGDTMRICADTQCELVFADSRYIRSQDAIDATRAAGIRVIDVFSDWENGEKICLPRVKSVPPRGELRYDIALDDVIVMAHTSGSTGRNKCVRKSMKSYFGKKGYCAAFRHAILAADYIAHLSVINVSPWYHNTGMYMLLLCVCGAAVTEVTITKSLSSQAIFPIRGRFVLSLSPPQPKRVTSLPLVKLRRVFKMFSRASGVCAKSMKTE